MSLQSSLTSVDQHCTSLEERLSTAKEQRKRCQSEAEEFCQKVQGQIIGKLQSLLPAAPKDIEARVKKDFPSIKTSSAAEAEEKIFETASLQQDAMADLKAQQQRQHGCLIGLNDELQKHRGSTLEEISKISQSAKEEIVENWSKTKTTLGLLDEVFSEIDQSSTENFKSVAKNSTLAEQGFRERVELLRKSLSEQRTLLEQSATKTFAALSAAQSAVSEQQKLSEESMTGALEAVEQLQEMHVAVLKQITEETSQSADQVQAGSKLKYHYQLHI